MNKPTPMTISEIDHLLDSLKYQNQFPNHTFSMQEIKKNIHEASQQMESLFNRIGGKGFIRAEELQEIEELILPTIRQAAEIPHLYHLFYELNSTDEYTYKHTICVGIIATLIGKWLELPSDELADLTLGATLHDIGKTKINPHILNKPGKLTNDEYEEIKLHTVKGYELVKETGMISERVALIALQHHEREDGKGYPYGLKGDQIHKFSKIVGIADVFHAMSSARVYHHPSPLYIVLNQMQNDAFGKFDPKIMLVFLNKMMTSLVGKRAELTGGFIGTIIMIHPYDPIRCLVKVDDHIIDLRYNPDLQIERIIEDD